MERRSINPAESAGTRGATGRRIRVSGVVQGVGFRPWVYRLASEEGISGAVRNDAAGVTIDAFGTARSLDRFLTRLKTEPPSAAVISSLKWRPIASVSPTGFRIAASRSARSRRASIPADIATCAQCLAELFDPRDRRYHYPFINCTNCGPRFTIVREMPYDRRSTTMAAFAMCRDCAREYESVENRRFHAEPNACPRCGPSLRLLAADGEQLSEADPIRAAARALDAGLVVAIKGLGGFHLACDATSAAAVARLRERKRREEKPFAVMVRELAEAQSLAYFSPQERQLLTSPERPIVLARRREDAHLASEIAPCNPLVGVLLAYTPLHHLLLAQCGRPLVMTSGNLSDEPIAYRNDEACARLSGVADRFLVHDREIVTRCDDSVVREIAGSPVVLRRSRGFVPRPFAILNGFRRPVLACGAQLKNTFCLAVGNEAYLGPHIGDLDSLETYAAFEDSIERLERFLGTAPEIVAHDLHPDYLSTRYALARRDVLHVAVQHHHAHVASAMAEHGLDGPVLGVAYDGTGYGTDGTAWGGEVMLADYAEFRRIATFRPLALAGGERAIREVWRIALAALNDAYGGAPPLAELSLFRNVRPAALDAVSRMLRAGFNSPRARGVGRYFDAAGAIVLAVTESRYEGQVAMMLNFAARAEERNRYRYEINKEGDIWEVDLRPTLRELVDDTLCGRDAANISARFHNTLVDVTVSLVREVEHRFGSLPVVLSGGCFQNDWLARGVVENLASDHDVYAHRQVPPGDGGLALGQAMVADKMAERVAGE
jgi:hydrogenase maturation protein HypF